MPRTTTLRQRVYIETSIPSFYFERRMQPEMLARRHWTRQWWKEQSSAYDLVTSPAVLEELERWKHPHREEALKLISSFPVLQITAEINAIVDLYIDRYVMPQDPRGDALHLALASFHQCHYLLTWNCRHLANATKFEHIRRVNTELKLFLPIITTPVAML
jgi:hypothetical protein